MRDELVPTHVMCSWECTWSYHKKPPIMAGSKTSDAVTVPFRLWAEDGPRSFGHPYPLQLVPPHKKSLQNPRNALPKPTPTTRKTPTPKPRVALRVRCLSGAGGNDLGLRLQLPRLWLGTRLAAAEPPRRTRTRDGTRPEIATDETALDPARWIGPRAVDLDLRLRT